MCQINTDPMRSQVHYNNVTPKFDIVRVMIIFVYLFAEQIFYCKKLKTTQRIKERKTKDKDKNNDTQP